MVVVVVVVVWGRGGGGGTVARLAQLGERRSAEREVAGSNPGRTNTQGLQITEKSWTRPPRNFLSAVMSSTQVYRC